MKFQAMFFTELGRVRQCQKSLRAKGVYKEEGKHDRKEESEMTNETITEVEKGIFSIF